MSILFVFTSADKTLTGGQTGWYLPEAAHPYATLAPHYNIDFASPAGGKPPVDQSSLTMFAKDEECQKFVANEAAQEKLANTKKLSDVKVEDYLGIYYVGGHGPVLDLPFDAVNNELASKFFQAGKLVSAVCHGTAALANVVDGNGVSIFKGRRFTGFSDAEEVAIQKVKDVPFLLESEIQAKGGIYEAADGLWGEKVVEDGNLITGQNPTSAGLIGRTILNYLQAQK